MAIGSFSISPIKSIKTLSTKRPRGRVHSKVQSRRNHKPSDYKARQQELSLIRLQANNLASAVGVQPAPLNISPYGIVLKSGK